jgi:hypothetical protein
MELNKIVDPQFQGILRKLAGQELPLRSAFTLKGIISNVNGELKKYDEVRGEALQRLGEKGEDGKVLINENGSVKLSEESMKSFVQEMNSLLTTNISVGHITAKDLGDKCSLSASDLLTLDDLIKE